MSCIVRESQKTQLKVEPRRMEWAGKRGDVCIYIIYVCVSGTNMIEVSLCPSNRKCLLLMKNGAEKNQEHDQEGIQLTDYTEKRSF